MTFKEAVLSAPGKQAFHARLYYNQVSPGKRAYIAHSHPAMEIGYFNNCHGTFTLKDKQYSIEPGDIFIFQNFDCKTGRIQTILTCNAENSFGKCRIAQG